MQYKRGLAFLLTALGLVGWCEGQTFKYAHLRWTHCSEGFYDPYFPEVCRTASGNPRAVGFTLTASWGVTEDDSSKMLQYAFSDVRTFIDSNQTIRDLRLYRNRNERVREKRIGWRVGQGLATTLPTTSDGGIVDCPVPPCIGSNTEYMMQIDRVSSDRTKVFARYSFEIRFPSDNVYSVYFQGCCRRQEVKNNPTLTFHVRTEVVVSQILDLPKTSLRFEMPDTILLRQTTPAVDGMQCSEAELHAMSQCSTEGCFHKFQLQFLHPNSAFRSKVSFRMANQNEMGKYMCYERVDPTDPESPMVLDSRLCPDYVRAATFEAPLLMGLSPGGIVEFRVDETGSWQATFVAVCEECGGPEKNLVSTMDFSVDVIKAWSFYNHQPPYSYFGDPSFLNGRLAPPPALLGITPLTTFDDPSFPRLKIQCGRTSFRIQAADTGGMVWDEDYFRVAFTDDFNAVRATCGLGMAQSIAAIWQQTDLPKGITMTELRLVESEQNAASGYMDVSWRPQCEDHSQVGSFLFCFQAEDRLRRPPFDNFAILTSYPGIGTSRSCVAVESMSALPNEPPAFLPPTMLTTCSSDCCDCCGRPACPCASDDTVVCCSAVYATAGDVMELVVRAFDPEPFETCVIYFENLQPDASLVSLPAGVDYPKVLPPKYGCGDKHYSECDEAAESAKRVAEGLPAEVTNDVQTMLHWDLGAMSLFTCVPLGSSGPIKCNGPRDTSTCPNGTPCQGSDIKKTIEPFKICYQAGEAKRPGVDVELWHRTFGRSPEARSCKVCFLMSVADKPFFIDFDPDFHYQGRTGVGTPFSGTEYNLAVGEELRIELLAAANNAGQVVQISLLGQRCVRSLPACLPAYDPLLPLLGVSHCSSTAMCIKTL